MPYRNAHWWILALFPLIAIAFWRNYLGQFRTAPFGLHTHGMTAAAWLELLGAQSWAIHARRPDWHRTAGRRRSWCCRCSPPPGPWRCRAWFALFAARTDPFHSAYGARLAVADMIAGPAVIVLVVHAFLQRRRVRAHAGAVLATGLPLLPPVFARVCRCCRVSG